MDTAQEKLRLLEKKLDKAASKNVIHKNKAARKVSRMTKRFNEAQAKQSHRPHKVHKLNAPDIENEGSRVSPFVFFLLFFFLKTARRKPETASFQNTRTAIMRQGRKKKDEEKRETGVLCKVPRGFPLFGISRDIFAGAHIDDTENRSRHACRCDDGARTIVTIFRPCLILLPCLFFRCTI